MRGPGRERGWAGHGQGLGFALVACEGEKTFLFWGFQALFFGFLFWEFQVLFCFVFCFSGLQGPFPLSRPPTGSLRGDSVTRGAPFFGDGSEAIAQTEKNETQGFHVPREAADFGDFH